ncbi:30S ribosomal protein S7p/S5e [Mucor mucedo]|uniref:30S ribosomal protein S7p/S5e n=1 Tax=Mucor mucedo TaxID=29922 RepID=UPI002220D2CA|nr:30S ribosomal protein S7p/S5e [Mucor mucedo]KAI7896713.1 30S ribosomal protein S7p/S5e [Mucor mucedo]
MSSTILQALRQNGATMRKFSAFTPTWIRPMSTAVGSTPVAPVTPVIPTMTSSEVPIVPNDEVVSQLVNTLMRDGKKARAQRLVSDSMKHLAKKIGEETTPYSVLLEAIESASPLLKLSSTKKGSKVVHVPTALRDRQRRRRAIVWMLDASKKRGEKSFEERFAAEVFDVSQGISPVLQKKQQVHKQALANRANAQVSYNTQR